MQDVLDQEKDFGFARVYAVELKYRQQPKLDRALLYEKMERYTGKFGQPNQEKADDPALHRQFKPI
ncbi:hypothetical protein [Brevibacillus borstelensis]|uniref:hypothetical protein n=1 Tax=Brevibacillus borstelensis TaxID=45462 RepID=UPI0030C59727